ncbi:MAG: YfcC family protein [Clostridia bacterium]|nr:YfcC family protein [Clostridia bacterium]
MSQEKQAPKGLGISAKTFITSLLILFVLMCLTYAAVWLVPGGTYDRVINAGGMSEIVPGSYTPVEGGLPFWKWLLSPVLALGASGGGTVLGVIAFLLVVGGVFNALDKSGLMKYMLDKLVHHYGTQRYLLMALIILFFMSMGAFIGSFEECVPLVPIVVSLAVALGWDELTGLGMSLLAIGCGFASGVCNPFTVGVAQELAGLPMFSGMGFRLLVFVLIYPVITLFVYFHAKKIEKPLNPGRLIAEFTKNSAMDRGLLCFAAVLLTGFLVVFSSAYFTFLQSLTMVIVTITFLVAGAAAVSLSGMTAPVLGKHFINGILSILPAVLMILMANSIQYTMTEGHIMDTVLHYALTAAEGLSVGVRILFIYLLVMLANFFISSGSAKAFLLIPLLTPLTYGLESPQVMISAFAFGDGFSNVLYPTNPVLLISLGLTGVSYGKWVKWTWKLQAILLILTALLLLGSAQMNMIGHCGAIENIWR